MSVSSKIVVIILSILSVLYIKDKFFNNVNFDFFNKNKAKEESITPEQTKVKSEVEEEKKVEDKKEKPTVDVFFLTVDDKGVIIFKKVKRPLSASKNQLKTAVVSLLQGPSYDEKTQGLYNEIPKGTKLLGLQTQGKNIVINLSSDFQYGGGTDSTYTRMRQLIKTVLPYSNGHNIYLYIDGKQADVIGGEGIMISQPLSENSLDE